MAGIGLENVSAVLLAGGLGTRIRELFPDIPKPLIPVAGLPVAEWIVRLWARQGVRHFVLSTGYLGDAMEAYFAGRPQLEGLRIECAREPSPMGTGGAMAFAAGSVALKDVLLIGNADSLCAFDIASCLAELEGRRADVLIGTCFREDTSQFGSVQGDADGRILSFQEKVPGPGMVNAGVYLMRKNLIPRLASRRPLSAEREVFPQWLREAALFLYRPIEGQFLDIGTPAGYAAATEFVESRPDFEAVRHLEWR